MSGHLNIILLAMKMLRAALIGSTGFLAIFVFAQLQREVGIETGSIRTDSRLGSRTYCGKDAFSASVGFVPGFVSLLAALLVAVLVPSRGAVAKRVLRSAKQTHATRTHAPSTAWPNGASGPSAPAIAALARRRASSV